MKIFPTFGENAAIIDADFRSDDVNVGFEGAYPVEEISDPYKGQTEITPSDKKQVLATEGKHLSSDIIVNPIPSNYGLITYDGSNLRIS